MGMWTTENQDTLAIVLRAFSEAANKNYGGHAFEAGYLQSLCVQLLGMMPKKYQQSFIDDMVRATQKQEREVIAKMVDKQSA